MLASSPQGCHSSAVNTQNSASSMSLSAKLRDYCLSAQHKRGQNEGRVFEAALGLTAQDAEQLRIAVLTSAQTYEAIPTEVTA